MLTPLWKLIETKKFSHSSNMILLGTSSLHTTWTVTVSSLFCILMVVKITTYHFGVSAISALVFASVNNIKCSKNQAGFC